jgi:PAS domain S-box-containing protein
MNTDSQNKALLEAIRKVQTEFLIEKSSNEVFDTLLSEILAITGSEYGFIGDIIYSGTKIPYLKTRAITNIAWDKKTKQFYEENAPEGLEFHNLDTLFGHVIKTGYPVIANHPATDKRAQGTPKGHPPLNSFLGLPIYLSSQLIGMVGISNKQGGYDEYLVNFLQPLLATCAHIIQAFNIKQQWKIADNQLKNRNAIDRAIFDNIVDGVITINEKGIILSVNPAIKAIFGYCADELIGNNVSHLMPEPYKSHHDGYLKNYLKKGIAKIIGIVTEVNGKHKRGFPIPIELTINEMRIDRECIFVGILRDISERKNTQKKLQETTSIQKAILDSANFTIISTTKKGIIKTFNSSAVRMLGYAKEEVINTQTPEIIHDKKEIIARAKQLSEELGYSIKPGFEVFVAKARLGQPDENEWTYIRKDKTTFSVMLSVTALYDSHNNITGFLGIGSDITERKKVEKTKNEFISSVSHELRTPLTSIRGSLGLILGGKTGDLSEKSTMMLKIANTNCERLIRLINDILDIEKIEFGKMPLKKADTLLNHVIETAINDNESYASSFNVKLSFEKNTKDSLIVNLDQDRIIQVLTNLLSNAIKYSPRGKTVVIKSKICESHVKIEVSDLGEGIPFEFHKSIFKRFSQADSSSTRKKGGTGLGLNIAKSIVDKHQGEIGFTSKIGKGCTFYFALPMTSSKSLAKSNGDEHIIANTHKDSNKKDKIIAKILHVEDDGDIAKIISAMVDSSVEITHSDTLKKAKNKIMSNFFDIVIIDICLPDGDGLELIPFIKEKSNCAIIILSAYETKPGTEKLVDSILTKSQNSIQHIKDTIHQFININEQENNNKDKC